MDYNNGRLILALLSFIFILADTFLANVVFVKNEKSIYSFLFIFIIIILLPGTSETVGYNQTNFFLLFFLLLVMYNINKPISGFYLALSLIIKPISGFLILFFMSEKKWKPIIYFVSTLIVLSSITAFFWGFQNIIGFFQSPPTQRLPQYLYVQDINQSILAILNRNLKGYGLTHNMINSIYYLIAIITTGLTYIASKRLNKINIYFSLFPFIVCMLMIYPSSLSHYMVYLFPVLLYFLLLLTDRVKKYFWLFILPTVSFLNTEVFFTYLVLWFVLLSIGFILPKTDGLKEKLKLAL